MIKLQFLMLQSNLVKSHLRKSMNKCSENVLLLVENGV